MKYLASLILLALTVLFAWIVSMQGDAHITQLFAFKASALIATLTSIASIVVLPSITSKLN